MPRRPATRVTADAEQTPETSLPAPSATSEFLTALRTNWKWAAFSQFFFTFSPLFAMDDVSLNDVEEDLVYGRRLVLPRIIIRLLFVLTYDRKVSLENWQTALRKQYNKRNPLANPIGPEPSVETDDDSVIEGSTAPEPSRELKTEDDAVVSNAEDEETLPNDPAVPIPLLAKKYHYLVNEAQAAELDERESKDWLDLPMLEKLDSLHLLTEWQFHNPTRVRTLMKTDDEMATWRIEPIGYDAKSNGYWLVGADRLWIQREPPRPPKQTKSLKRKRPATNSIRLPAPAKRQRVQSEANKSKQKAAAASVISRSGRAAKAQAKLKLNAQAKELAELNRQAALLAEGQNGTTSRSRLRKGSPSVASTKGRPLGTRISARLRGTPDDEWQSIPNEWLNDAGGEEDEESQPKPPRRSRSRRKLPKTGLESDASSISDLTELSDVDEEGEDEEEEGAGDAESRSATPEPEEEEEYEPEQEEPTDPIVLQDFIEWETICVTLDEWEHIAERWKGATHYAEKALYKVLTKTVVPVITEELREIERKKTIEEAVVHRKRSSRIAMKEHAKEEVRQAAKKKQEEDERTGRARRAEARQLKDEAARLRREQRRLEEEEEEKKNKQDEGQDSQDTPVDVVGDDTVLHNYPVSQHPGILPGQTPSSKSGTSTPSDWELDCEICLRKGTNLDDGPLVSCEECRKWQHIVCHDRADEQAGRAKRNWKRVEFICRHCRLRRAAAGYHQPPSAHPSLSLRIPPFNQQPQQAPPAVNPYLRSPDYQTKGYVPDAGQKSISFSHYHPQQGFSHTPSHQSYLPSSATQSYSQLAASQHPQYGQAVANGLQQTFHRTNGWNVPVYAPTYPEPGSRWSPASAAGNTAPQFNYYTASYQAHS